MMAIGSFKKFIFKELIFPKTLIIDYPGVLINKRVGKFSKKFNMIRVVYVFEKFVVDLYDKTLEAIGKEDTDLLWYKISKNSATRFTLFSGDFKVPNFLFSTILKYIFQSMTYLGISFANSFKIEGKSIVTRGKNSFICRKNNAGCISAGYLSAIWSYLNGENIEAEACCGKCSSECKIVANKNIAKKCDVDYDAVKPMGKYNLVNFKDYDAVSFYGGVSLSDFVKFGKIMYDDEEKISYYKGEGVAYVEVGLSELIYEGYKKINKERLFRDILITTSEELMEKFSSGSVSGDFREMENLLSAFGWGVPICLRKEKNITYKFVHPPISRYIPIFRATILNGFLNKILDKKYKIKHVDNFKMVFEEV